LGFSEARAGVLRYCDPPADQSAAQQDQLLRMSAMVRDRLAALGSNVAMVARSGLNLSWWDQRYSHAGLSLRHNPSGPWFIRQLYYDCTARQPRLFDEGLAGFVSGVADPEHSYLLVLALPSSTSRGAAESEEEQGAPDVSIERLALHSPTALGLLGSQYSANAHAFSTRFQNCNQWLIELLALGLQPGAARGATPNAARAPTTRGLRDEGRDQDQSVMSGLRSSAQALLREQGYTPTTFTLGHPLVTWFAGRIPWLSLEDHPPEDLQQDRLRVSMPASIAAHLVARVPSIIRIEACLKDARIVLRENGPPLDDHCRAMPGDQVLALD
jgi:hypothetical protein